MGDAGIIFAAVWYGILLFACIGIGWLGWGLIDRLGRYPSRTPVLQVGIWFPYMVITVVSVTMLLLFFKVLSVD